MAAAALLCSCGKINVCGQKLSPHGSMSATRFITAESGTLLQKRVRPGLLFTHCRGPSACSWRRYARQVSRPNQNTSQRGLASSYRGSSSLITRSQGVVLRTHSSTIVLRDSTTHTNMCSWHATAGAWLIFPGPLGLPHPISDSDTAGPRHAYLARERKTCPGSSIAVGSLAQLQWLMLHRAAA